ncbi:AzlC family ABC transporter permease [Aeromicrobium panaciterrae]|uniref:AzlC family ABC transporter permease n=1 Tax=Aeromicrobium panaciterrae TaxID=363861 RepID=UPI0031DE2AA1
MTSDRSVIVDSLGVGLATGAYGVSFGALSTSSSGLTVLQTCVMSLFVFTGATQFAFIGTVASGGNPVAGALTATLLGSRNLFYGLSIAQKLRLSGPARLASAHLVIDESTATSVTRDTTRQARLGFFWTGLSIFVLWNITTLLGAIAGENIGDPKTYGLDAAVGAAFLGLLWPRLATWQGRLVALVGAAVALGAIPLTSPGIPIIIGGAVAVLLGMLWQPRERT